VIVGGEDLIEVFRVTNRDRCGWYIFKGSIRLIV